MENEENLYEVPPGLRPHTSRSETSLTTSNQGQIQGRNLPLETSNGSLTNGQNNSKVNSGETGANVHSSSGSAKAGGSSSSSSTVVSPEKRANGYTEYLTPSLPHALDTLSQSTQASSTGTSICGLSDKNGGKNYNNRRSSRVSAMSQRSIPKKMPRSRKKSQRTFESQPSPMDTIRSQIESKSDSLSGSTGHIVDQRSGSKNIIYDAVAKVSIASGQSHTLEQLSAQIEAHEVNNSPIVPLIPNRKRSSVISTGKSGGSTKGQNVARICTRQHYPSGLYGWRKRILYFIILIASCLTVINLALIAYLYSALDLSLLDGSFGGSVLITSNGILVSGTSVFVNSTLAARNIRSQSPQEPLNIESSSENILISSLKGNSISPENATSLHKLFISPESVNIMSDRLYIRKANGQLVFSADANKFTVASDHLRILRELLFQIEPFSSPDSVYIQMVLVTNSDNGPVKYFFQI